VSSPDPDATHGAGRTYAGLRPDERRAERRRRLVDAGLQVFGTTRWDDAGIALLCATARVGTRAFYEEFDSREALLLEVATGIVMEGAGQMQAALAAAPATLEAKVRAGLSTYLRFMTEDPRRARVAYGAVPAAGDLLGDRHRASAAFAELIAAEAAELGVAPRAVGNPLLALALTGAAGELLGYWAATTPAPDVEAILEELVALFLAALS
jgi:AcrR family transcriptional regulator